MSVEGIMVEIVVGFEGVVGCDDVFYYDLDVKGKIVLVQRFCCLIGGIFVGRLLFVVCVGVVVVIIYYDIIINVMVGLLLVFNFEYVFGGFINLVDGECIKMCFVVGEILEVIFQQIQVIEMRII